MNNPQLLLRDPEINPTDKVIKDCLGTVNSTYIKFIDKLKHNDITLMDWRYYNDGKSWLSKGEYKWKTQRGTNKVTPLFWLSIWDSFFRVTFFFSTNKREELLSLPISKDAKAIINNAEPMGKTMKFIPIIFDINNELQLDDICTLAQYRKENI